MERSQVIEVQVQTCFITKISKLILTADCDWLTDWLIDWFTLRKTGTNGDRNEEKMDRQTKERPLVIQRDRTIVTIWEYIECMKANARSRSW